MPRYMTVLTCIALAFPLNFPWAALAFKGPLAPPTLKTGQFVYTVPEGFQAEGLSALQIQQLNGELAKLHNPFYVVVLENLPDLGDSHNEYARSNGFRGDTDTRRVEVTTAMLMEDWAATEPGYNPGVTSVFLIAFHPRKFAWHPGTTWLHEVGIDKAAQEPYTAHFVRAAKTKPADYGRGIANLASALDEYTFDQTDPERIAARKEAERQRAEAERLQTARGSLDGEILRLSEILDDAQDVMNPPAQAPYRETMAKAKAVRAKDVPLEMLAEAQQLKLSTDVLEAYVSDLHHNARIALLGTLLQWFTVATGFGCLIFLVAWRRKRQKGLIRKFEEAFDEWSERVQNAENMWSSHYLDRESIIGLNSMTGRSKALWDETTRTVDQILIRIQAMGNHLKECRALFKRGHFLNLKPMQAALDKLEAPFTFDTGAVNEADLFGRDTVTMQVEPGKFAAETKAMFKASIDGWKRLKDAANLRLGAAVTDCPHKGLDEMFKLADEWKIPPRWFREHPLFGDDASDAAYYATLDDLRTRDPLAYAEKVAEFRQTEERLRARLNQLVAVRRDVAQVRVSFPFNTSGTIVSPDDDPTVTIATAQQAEAKLEGLFGTAPSLDEVKEQALVVIDAYTLTARQGLQIEAAIHGAAQNIADAKSRGAASAEALEEATRRAAGARPLFKMGAVDSSLASAKSFQDKGSRKIRDAGKALEDKRHLAAQRIAQEAVGAFDTATRHSREAIKLVNALEKDRVTYMARAAGMSKTRSGYEATMQTYGAYGRSLSACPVYVPSAADGPQDYAMLLGTLDKAEATWRAECRHAEDAYEAEQLRRRRAREAEERRRRDEEEADRRRRSYYSSSYSSSSRSSSSSSDSFGGGGFGGSSGSFGGGGFGGSSGSF